MSAKTISQDQNIIFKRRGIVSATSLGGNFYLDVCADGQFFRYEANWDVGEGLCQATTFFIIICSNSSPSVSLGSDFQHVSRFGTFLKLGGYEKCNGPIWA